MAAIKGFCPHCLKIVTMSALYRRNPRVGKHWLRVSGAYSCLTCLTVVFEDGLVYSKVNSISPTQYVSPDHVKSMHREDLEIIEEGDLTMLRAMLYAVDDELALHELVQNGKAYRRALSTSLLPSRKRIDEVVGEEKDELQKMTENEGKVE